jgi:hypothetical protein
MAVTTPLSRKMMAVYTDTVEIWGDRVLNPLSYVMRLYTRV